MQKLVFLLLSFYVILSTFMSTTYAQQHDKILELKKKIDEEKQAIETLSKTEKNIKLTLSQINQKIKLLKEKVATAEKAKMKLESELQYLFIENKKINSEIEKKREEIGKRLILWHKTYLLKPEYPITVDFKQPLLFENYMKSIFNYDRQLFNTLKENQALLLKNLEHIKVKKNEVIAIEKELIQKKYEQEELERLQKKKLSETKKEKEVHAKNLKNTEIALKKLEQLLKQVEKISEYSGKGLSVGVLPYPVVGNIVGHFGKEEGMAKGSLFARKGIEIAAKEGDKVRAVDNGKIVYTGWIKNLGNICIISHGKRYYTVYGRLSSLTKAKNDTVKQGDVIGVVGSEANFFEFPTLYFEIREGDKPLDPEKWLR